MTDSNKWKSGPFPPSKILPAGARSLQAAGWCSRLLRRSHAWWLKIRYEAAILLSRPTRGLVDDYFRQFPDVYRIARNGDERFDAIVHAIHTHIGECSSILDVACHEGYALQYVARRTAVTSLVGLDLSGFALEKARNACAGTAGHFHQFDLTELYCAPDLRLPVAQPCDIVLVCEVLYYIGPHAHHLWGNPARDLSRKIAFIRSLQRYARRAVILQHFGTREREAIYRVAMGCGGRLVDETWGLYLLDGLAE